VVEPWGVRRFFVRDTAVSIRHSHSTVTLFARFLGLSTSVPRATAV
jgi:hypothetical protein